MGVKSNLQKSILGQRLRQKTLRERLCGPGVSPYLKRPIHGSSPTSSDSKTRLTCRSPETSSKGLQARP